MIKPILSRYLSPDEFHTLVKSIRAAIDSSSIEETLKEKLKARLDKEFSNYESAINRLKKNPLTLVKEEKDDIRDARFLGFRSITEALTHHWEDEKREAATQLIEIIRRHGWSIHNEGYTVESATMNSLIQELQKEPASGYIEKTETQEWLQQLIASQADFEKTYIESEELDTQQKPLITSGRKALYKDLLATLNFIEGQAQFNASEELSQLIDNINQVITTITTSAKARNTRKQTDDVMNA